MTHYAGYFFLVYAVYGYLNVCVQWQTVVFEPLIRSIFSTGVLLSRRMVWPAVMMANDPFSGGDRPPHVNLDDQTSM